MAVGYPKMGMLVVLAPCGNEIWFYLEENASVTIHV